MATTLKDLGISKANAEYCVASKAQYEPNEWNADALSALQKTSKGTAVRYLHLNDSVKIGSDTVDCIFVSANAAAKVLSDKSYLTKCQVSSYWSEKTNKNVYTLICNGTFEECDDEVEF